MSPISPVNDRPDPAVRKTSRRSEPRGAARARAPGFRLVGDARGPAEAGPPRATTGPAPNAKGFAAHRKDSLNQLMQRIDTSRLPTDQRARLSQFVQQASRLIADGDWQEFLTQSKRLVTLREVLSRTEMFRLVQSQTLAGMGVAERTEKEPATRRSERTKTQRKPDEDDASPADEE